MTLAVFAQGPVATPAPPAGSMERGESLFLGKLPLVGKPRGHEDWFPTAAVRCVNCHSTEASNGKLKLDRAFLMEPRARRGGPPSAYDEAKFCKLLQTGIDPVYVMVDHTMPIYEVSDLDCAGLWAFLSRKDISK